MYRRVISILLIALLAVIFISANNALANGIKNYNWKPYQFGFEVRSFDNGSGSIDRSTRRQALKLIIEKFLEKITSANRPFDNWGDLPPKQERNFNILKIFISDKFKNLPNLNNRVSKESIVATAQVRGSNNVSAAPEPATILLFGAGLVGLAGYGRKKFKKKS